MSRFSERARIASSLSVVLVSCVSLASLGCEQLDGRNRVREGNQLFRETQFVDAVAQYQKALTVVDDPVIHYNAGLAYSKVFKPGFDGPVLLGVKGEFVCDNIPGAKLVQAGACVKPGDRHFAECGSAKTAPIEKVIADLEAQKSTATDDKKKDLDAQIKDKKDELGRLTCASSFQCVEGEFCSLTSPELAELAGQHFQAWIKVQPSDDEIRKLVTDTQEKLDAAKKADNKSRISEEQRKLDDLTTKDQTRKIMTQLWIDADQHKKAIDYWEGLLQEKPNDTAIMGILAGITLHAQDWRKAIEWYMKVADATSDPSGKVASYNFIGNVAWAKLNSRQLVGPDAVELADRGLGALQRAAELQPKVPRMPGLQGSIYNFRSTAHGASWAAAIDRASAEDLRNQARVLIEEAKKAQGQAPGAPAAPAAPGAPPAGGGSAAPAATGSAGSAAGSAVKPGG